MATVQFSKIKIKTIKYYGISLTSMILGTL